MDVFLVLLHQRVPRGEETHGLFFLRRQVMAFELIQQLIEELFRLDILAEVIGCDSEVGMQIGCCLHNSFSAQSIQEPKTFDPFWMVKHLGLILRLIEVKLIDISPQISPGMLPLDMSVKLAQMRCDGCMQSTN